MSTLPRILSLVTVTLALAITGCETTKIGNVLSTGLSQEVTIDSEPSNASAFVNGKFVGRTPLTMSLPRKVTHEVRLEKTGYKSLRKYFRPQTNERGRAYVQFGLMDQFGLYKDLTPTNMVAKMSHSLLPLSRSAEPFEDMAYRVMLVDALLDAGAITRREHSSIYKDIVDFYTN